MIVVRTSAVVAVLAVVFAIAACSSSDDALPTDLERTSARSDGGETDGASSDAKAQLSDAAGDVATGDATAPTIYAGQATYYAADGTGACGFKATPNDLDVAAMNGSQYKKSWCGQCVLVTGPNGMVKVRIVDLCPGCAYGGLDLSEQAFASIAALSAGRVKITWHFVPC
jgi:expansin (peptidoglycan-binding protein)